jgi:hypothetical protein
VLDTARAPGTMPATFLLDEFLELRTFESFPGLRSCLRDLIGALGVERQPLRPDEPLRRARAPPAARRAGAVRDHPRRAAQRGRDPRDAAGAHGDDHVRGIDDPEDEVERQRDEIARLVQALSTAGRPTRGAIAETAVVMSPRGDADPVSALAALMSPGGQLAQSCRFCYELRLHRARGYGALKAILEVLAQEEPLTLTRIAQRLRRTPGSTKDYLSWLEDVDLIVLAAEAYSYADPMLRACGSACLLPRRPAGPTTTSRARFTYVQRACPTPTRARPSPDSGAGVGDKRLGESCEST